MKVHTENLPDCRVQIQLQFDVKDVQAAFAKVYRDLNRQGQVPGFRPGRTPKVLLVRHYGEDAISGMAKYELLSDTVEEVLKDLDLVETPELPDLEELQVAEDQPLEVVFTATVGPRVTVGDLSGIEILKPSVDVSEEDVEEVIAQLREIQGEEVKPDRDVVATGDVVDLEVEITLEGDDDDDDDGAPIEEFEESLRVGAGDHFPPIDDKLVGRIVGQTIEMDATYPEDYHDEELAGRSAHLKARIVALRELRLPPLNDEFAREVDKDCETLDDLRAMIRRDMERRRALFGREEVDEQVTEALLERCEVELPEVLLMKAMEEECAELAREHMAAGENFETFRQAMTMSDNLAARQVFARVHRALSFHAIVHELTKQRGIEVGEDNLAEQAAIYASQNDLELSYVTQAASVQREFKERLESQAVQRKVFEAVMADAEVRELAMDEYLEIQQEREAQRAAEAAAAAVEQDALQAQDAAADDDAPEGAGPGGEQELAEAEDEQQPAPAVVAGTDTGQPSAIAPDDDDPPVGHQTEDRS